MNKINLKYQLLSQEVILYTVLSCHPVEFFFKYLSRIYQNCQTREKQVLQECVREMMKDVRDKELLSNSYGKIFLLVFLR